MIIYSLSKPVFLFFTLHTSPTPTHIPVMTEPPNKKQKTSAEDVGAILTGVNPTNSDAFNMDLVVRVGQVLGANMNKSTTR